MCEQRDMAYFEELVRLAKIGEATLKEICPELLFDESCPGCAECALIFACRARKGMAG